MSIYVANLSYEVTKDELSSLFAEYGSVKKVYIPHDRETGQPGGIAFVEMDSEASEFEARENLDGKSGMVEF